MKIVDESIVFFSLKILSGSSLHFLGIKVFIVGCVWNAKSQLQLNRVFWRLSLVTGMSHEFESRARYLARLELFSYSATAGVTLHASHMCHLWRLASCESVVRSSCEALLEFTLLSFSSHSLTHYPYMIPT